MKVDRSQLLLKSSLHSQKQGRGRGTDPEPTLCHLNETGTRNSDHPGSPGNGEVNLRTKDSSQFWLCLSTHRTAGRALQWAQDQFSALQAELNPEKKDPGQQRLELACLGARKLLKENEWLSFFSSSKAQNAEEPDPVSRYGWKRLHCPKPQEPATAARCQGQAELATSAP